MKRVFQVFVIALSFFALQLEVVYAQDAAEELDISDTEVEATPFPPPNSAINLTVSPVTLFIESDPGQTVDSNIRIRNNGSETEHLLITLGKFIADENGDKPKLLEPDPNDPSLSWVNFDKTTFSISPGEWETIAFDFTAPDDAAFSYYYTIIVSRQADPVTEGGEAQVKGSPAILLLTTVNSPYAKRELSVESFLAKFPIQEFLPQEFEINIQNKGNVHVVPEGNVFIDGQGKNDLAILSINAERRAILPNSARTFTVKWDDGFPRRVDTSDANQEKSNTLKFWGVEWDFSKAHTFRFGRYTAHLLMVYDNGERDVPIESFVSFWVIPWKILLLLLFVLLLVIVGVRSTVMSVVRMFKKSK